MRTTIHFFYFFCVWSFLSTAASLDVHDTIGGDFELNSTLGKKIGPQSFRGKVLLIFSDNILPGYLSRYFDNRQRCSGKLRAYEVEQVQPLFISVDPERDTLKG